MKNIFLTFIFLSVGYAQDKFEFTKNGFTDYVVTSVELSQSEIYNKTINWIKENYKNPNEVIKMTIENEKLRFSGYKEKFICAYGACSDLAYTIEISFKEGKYKFDPIEATLYTNNNKVPVDLNNTSIHYDKNGNLKNFSKGVPESYENHFNQLNEKLKNYLDGSGKKSEDW